MEATSKQRKPRHRRRFALSLALLVAASCARTTIEPGPTPNPPLIKEAGPPAIPTTVVDAGITVAETSVATLTPWSPSKDRVDGPFETLSLDAGRWIYFAFPRSANVDGGREGLERPYRLIGHLHGMCGPPPYACGKWISAGTDVGAMVCPTGNARCGDSPYSPPSWEAPTWMELVGIMDKDLETSVAKVEARRKGSIRKEGAVLTGYSRGAYAAPIIARSHPGRWRFLVLIEANAPLSAAGLRASGLRAVALVAGEYGDQIAGMKKTQGELERDGFPAKLFVMKKTGHPYSEDMEYVMHDALEFVLGYENGDGGT